MSKDDDDAPSETARENREAPDDALLACRRAIASDPANAANWEHLGDLLVRRSQTYEAREAYARAYELQPDLLTQWIVPGANAAQRAQIDKLFSIGLGLNDAGHFEASLRVFEALAVIEPTWSFPLTLCGMMLCNLRQYAEALPYLDRALALIRRTSAHGRRRRARSQPWGWRRRRAPPTSARMRPGAPPAWQPGCHATKMARITITAT
jgi:tetratricopeptide (TPR) repeat protein